MKNKIYVVEGTHDEALLKQVFPNIRTISVGGSSIKDDVLSFLIKHQDELDIILIMDPDYPGEQIRKKVAEKLKSPIHIFINRKDAISKNKKKIGLEHLSVDIIKGLINDEIIENNTNNVLNLSDLFELGLTYHEEALPKRKIITDYYHIGFCNTKTLLKRLNWLGVTINDLKGVIDNASN